MRWWRRSGCSSPLQGKTQCPDRPHRHRGLPPEAAKAVAGAESGDERFGGGVARSTCHRSTTRLKYAANRIIDCPHDTPIYDPTGNTGGHIIDIDSGTLDLSRAYRVDESEYLRRIRRAKVVPKDILYGREGERWVTPLLPERNESSVLDSA